jgi:hypothetical protein
VSISPDPPTQSKKPVVVYIGGCNVTRGGVERTHTQGIVHYLRKHADLYFIVGDLGIGATVPMPLEREALKETISRFLSMSADQLDAMEQRAWDILCERFTWDKRGDQILGWVHENLP